MSEARRTVSIETIAYIAVVGVAVWLRLSTLGTAPLGNREAELALSVDPSLSEFTMESTASPSPSYRAVTRLAFTLFGADEVSARLVPALAGLLIVLTPILLRGTIGRGSALLASAFFALSPTLWLASRTASGATLGILGLLLAFALLVRPRGERGMHLEWAAAGIGLGLASGSMWFTGLASVGVGVGLSGLLWRRLRLPNPRTLLSGIPIERIVRSMAIGGLVALGISTGLGFLPEGLRGVFGGLDAWASGWFQPGGQAPGTLLLTLVAYEPLALIFGGIGLVVALGHRTPFQSWLGAWAIGALLVVMIYPAREPASIVWLVLPLLLLASHVAGELLDRIAGTDPIWITLAAAAAVLALLSFSYLQFRSYVGTPDAFQQVLGLPTLLVLGLMGLGLVVIALFMLGFGWSSGLAQNVAALAALIGLAALDLSAGAQLNLGEPGGTEIARGQVGTYGLFTLRDSLTVLSEAQHGRPEALPIQVGNQPTASLAWALRGYPRLRSLDPQREPPVVLVLEETPLPGEYLGQSLTVGASPAWNGWLPPDLMDWLLTRKAPTLHERWVLLVRQDVAGVDELVLGEDQLPETAEGAFEDSLPPDGSGSDG